MAWTPTTSATSSPNNPSYHILATQVFSLYCNHTKLFIPAIPVFCAEFRSRLLHVWLFLTIQVSDPVSKDFPSHQFLSLSVTLAWFFPFIAIITIWNHPIPYPSLLIYYPFSILEYNFHQSTHLVCLIYWCLTFGTAHSIVCNTYLLNEVTNE